MTIQRHGGASRKRPAWPLHSTILTFSRSTTPATLKDDCSSLPSSSTAAHSRTGAERGGRPSSFLRASPTGSRPLTPLESCIATWRGTWRQAIELLTGVADGIATAHAAGILHRDIARNGAAGHRASYGRRRRNRDRSRRWNLASRHQTGEYSDSQKRLRQTGRFRHRAFHSRKNELNRDGYRPGDGHRTLHVARASLPSACRWAQ